MKIPHIISFILLLSFCFATAGAQTNVINKKADRFIQEKMQEHHIPGLSLAVVRKGRVVHIKGYGAANLELKVPVTTETSFSIMSITKTFTAVGVMALVEQGRFSLEDKVSKYLASLPAHWQAVTIRQMLSHTSGIPSFTNDRKLCQVDKQVRDYTREDVLKEVSCFPLDFASGEKWAYGDTGYHLLGMTIEKVSGKSYGDFLNERILARIGMKATRNNNYKDLVVHRASGYTFANGGFKNADRMEIDEFANGGLLSTAFDMAKFEQIFTTEKVLRRATLE
jgi:CubicO group peptidase (beta-lactamase class C family)